jgi:hypothetical protein
MATGNPVATGGLPHRVESPVVDLDQRAAGDLLAQEEAERLENLDSPRAEPRAPARSGRPEIADSSASRSRLNHGSTKTAKRSGAGLCQ